MGPLNGVRIIDMTSVLMGPCATQWLGDLGADVVKVEPPDGDIVRQIGPGRHDGMGGMFLNLNRSKRSVVINLKTQDGKAILLELVKTADVLFYNVRPQAMQRLGLDYATVAAVNPRIIYAGAYGYGEGGPYSERPAYDDLIQGATGVAMLTAQSGDGVPRYSPVPIADRMVGLYAAGSIMAALYARERDGQGQSIEIPMFETMAAQVLGDHMSGLTFDPPLDHGGYQRLLSRDRRPFKTRDGYICAVIYNDKHWDRFFHATGRSEILRDPRFANHASRTAHIAQIYAEVATIFLERTSAEWKELLEHADIPVMPIHTLESLLEDEHLKARDFFPVVEHPSEGMIRSVGVPTTWSGTQPQPGCPAPLLGQHTADVLQQAGFKDADISRWAAGGVIGVG